MLKVKEVKQGMKIEIRSANEAIISGYVNAVERDSKVLPKTMSPNAKTKFVEKIKAKTFERALSKAENVELRFNHKEIIGSTKNGNLTLHEDNIGLFAEAKITDAKVIEQAKKNELRGWSFGFVANHDEWEDLQDDMQRRNLNDIELREVSILTITPAYVGTSIEMRDEECQVIETRGCSDNCKMVTVQEDKPTTSNSDLSKKMKMEIEILKLRGV